MDTHPFKSGDRVRATLGVKVRIVTEVGSYLDSHWFKYAGSGYWNRAEEYVKCEETVDDQASF
jgi:hypothetical protein